jgi:HTH-type transcriptional regulator/antitoxin HipB
MDEFPVRTPEKLHRLLQGFRKQAGFTQAEVASPPGVTQQTLSSLQRNAKAVRAARTPAGSACG